MTRSYLLWKHPSHSSFWMGNFKIAFFGVYSNHRKIRCHLVISHQWLECTDLRTKNKLDELVPGSSCLFHASCYLNFRLSEIRSSPLLGESLLLGCVTYFGTTPIWGHECSVHCWKIKSMSDAWVISSNPSLRSGIWERLQILLNSIWRRNHLYISNHLLIDKVMS